jgi:hypothetical protein
MEKCRGTLEDKTRREPLIHACKNINYAKLWVCFSLSLIELSTLKQSQTKYQNIQPQEAFFHACFKKFEFMLGRDGFRRNTK